MSTILTHTTLILIIVLVPSVLAFWGIWRVRRLKGTVSPVADKILRPAGYSLSLKIEEMTDGLIHRIALPLALFVLSLSPIMIFSDTIVRLNLPGLVGVLGGCFVALIASVVISAITFRSYFNSLSNHSLGLRGEWLVAEKLSFLLKDGFRVYHDFPLKDLAKEANIDHIVVGPTGVFAIETKMRRKHRKVQGNRESHQVEYDGNTLQYPSFEDRHGINQALANAKYLERFIRKETDLAIPVVPILILPGWYVVQKFPSKLQVVSHKVAPDRIKKHRNHLPPDQQKKVCRSVERECRDVVV